MIYSPVRDADHEGERVLLILNRCSLTRPRVAATPKIRLSRNFLYNKEVVPS